MRFASLVTAAVVIAMPVTLAAQMSPPAGAGPRVGILAGLSSATFGGSDIAPAANDAGFDKKRRNGLVAGVYATLPFGVAGLSIRPEILYAQKGVKYAGSYQISDPTISPGGRYTVTFTATNKLDYLEVPVLLQFAIPQTAGLRPAVYAGPSVAYRVRCRSELAIGGRTESMGCDDVGDTTGDGFVAVSGPRKFDLSGVVGGQIGVALGGQALGLGVRYTHGFTNIIKDIDSKNRTLSVYGTIAFPFGR